jgi:LPXTG-motif cell wall-anchored protein
VWFTENTGNKIGRVTTAGVITEFAVPTSNSGPQNITTGADGNIWFTEQNAGNLARLAVAASAGKGSKGGTTTTTGTGGTGFGGADSSTGSNSLTTLLVVGVGLAAAILGTAGVTSRRRRRARP